MPSITTWTRLEPRARENDIRVGLQARVHDPLWLLGRQWQLGEFQGEDAGSPVVARVEADSFALTRYLPRPLPTTNQAAGQPFDALVTPLETIVEREPVVRAGGVNLRVAADAGQHFRRLLVAAGLSAYLPAYLARYAFQPAVPGDGTSAFDDASRRLVAMLAGRTVDGARLFAALAAGNFPNPGLPGLPVDPAVPAADRDRAVGVAQQWLAWYGALLSEPADGATPWLPERMEYEFA